MTKDEALKQPEQEPVAWRFRSGTWFNREAHWRYINTLEGADGLLGLEPLYTTPPQRTWVGLNAFDRMFIRTDCTTLFQQHHDEKTNTTYIGEKTNWDMLFEAIEAKLREKNNGT